MPNKLTIADQRLKQGNFRTITHDEYKKICNGHMGWSALQLAEWGISWPPKKGWLSTLRANYEKNNYKSNKFQPTLASLNHVYFDGGCNFTTKEFFCCVASATDNDFQVKHYGEGTNNDAEWNALLLALIISNEKGFKDINLFGDSMLVVNQALGKWRIKQDKFNSYKQEFDVLITLFDSYSLKWVPRENNYAGIYLEKHYKP